MSDWITAVAAIVLVFVTSIYTWVTWQNVVETRSASQQAIRPALLLSPEVLGVNYPIARVTNVGPGAAVHIVGELQLRKETETIWNYAWKHPLLGPGEYEEFILRTDSTGNTVEKLVEQHVTFHASIRYEGPFGQRFAYSGVADWRDLLEHVWGAGQRRKLDYVDRAAKSLEKIADHLARVVDFDGLRVMTYREKRQRDAEWSASSTRDSGGPEAGDR